MEPKKLLLEMLKTIKANGPKVLSSGICGNYWNVVTAYTGELRKFSCQASDVMRGMFHRWPEYSGDYAFPIRTDKSRSANTQFDRSGSVKTMWSTRYPYGRARWRLLNWMIQQLEAEIGQETTN